MSSKVEKELTPEEVVELLEALAKTPGGHVLAVIKEAAKKRGVEISLMGASSFRDGALHPYLTRLREARHKSEMLAEAVTAGDESGLLAGGRTALAEKVVDFLMTDDATPKQFSSLALTLQMLSSSNQGDKLTQAKLRAFEVKEEERQAAKQKIEEKKAALIKKGGVSKEAIELMEESLELFG
ncbi:MAG: hypothetical protein ABIS50_11505 [Luteolibacter sp.]|uniref:hypothetical protein n=1 Tax=Luteolibacter sp. TaxID=1962973 RepID=UPI003267C67E